MPPQCRLGHKSHCPADTHWCIGCPHPVTGPAVTGSPNVLVNFLPATRVTDMGVHMACCGPNIWQASQGSSTVFINFLPAHRLGDQDAHCGGVGKMIEGSPDVMTG